MIILKCDSFSYSCLKKVETNKKRPVKGLVLIYYNELDFYVLSNYNFYSSIQFLVSNKKILRKLR